MCVVDKLAMTRTQCSDPWDMAKTSPDEPQENGRAFPRGLNATVDGVWGKTQCMFRALRLSVCLAPTRVSQTCLATPSWLWSRVQTFHFLAHVPDSKESYIVFMYPDSEELYICSCTQVKRHVLSLFELFPVMLQPQTWQVVLKSSHNQTNTHNPHSTESQFQATYSMDSKFPSFTAHYHNC